MGWLRSSSGADHRWSADDRCSTASAKTLRCVSAKAVGVACLSWRTPGLSGQARRDDLGQMRKPTAGVHSALAVLSDRVGRLPRSRLIPHQAESRARRELFRRCLGVAVRALWLRAEPVDVRRAAGRMQDDDVPGPRFEVCRAAGREWLFPFGELNPGGRLVHSRFAGSSPLASSSPGSAHLAASAAVSGLAAYRPQPGHRESRLGSKGARRKLSAGGAKNTWTRACWLALVCRASSVWKDTSERKCVEPRGTG